MTTSTASSISPVHGGLAKPVNRIEPKDRVNFPSWRKFPAVDAVQVIARRGVDRLAREGVRLVSADRFLGELAV